MILKVDSTDRPTGRCAN